MKLHISRPFLLATILFFCSGALGLGYELVWIRKATLVVGASQIALSTVLTSFFLGMGVGSYVVGRHLRSRRLSPLWVYGLFEAGIGIYALAFPSLFRLLESTYGTLYPLVEGSGAGLFALRFILLFVLCFPPTFLMGGTLPLLLDGLVEKDRSIGSQTSFLYGVNILGAVAGVLVTCYFAIPILGMNVSSVVGGFGNLTIGVLALLFFRRKSPLHVDVVSDEPKRFYVGCGFVSGFLAIAYQICWARYFTLFEVTTIYTTAMLLAVYLLALAVGSLLLAPLLHMRFSPLRILATVQFLVPIATLYTLGWWRWVDFKPKIAAQSTAEGTYVPLDTLEVHYTWTVFSETFDTTFLAPFLEVALVVFVPVVLLGVGLPAIISAAARHTSELRSVAGRLVFWNTLGSSAGAFVAGYVLLPLVGLHWTLGLLGVGSLGLALAVHLKAEATRLLRWAGYALPTVSLLAIVGFLVLKEDTTRHAIQNYGFGVVIGKSKWVAKPKRAPKLVEVVEGPLATSFLFDREDRFHLGSGSISLATVDKEGIPGQAVQGHIPVLFYSGEGTPENCLGLCMGSGQSFGSLLLYPIRQLDVVDISSSIVDLALRHFADYNHDLASDERVRFHLDDGRHFVERAPDEFYDIVSMEPPPPVADGVYSLYSVEFYREVRRVLRPGGVLMQWLPLYRVTPMDAKSILRTQFEVFPETFVVKQGDEDFMVLSYMTRPKFDVAAIRKRCEVFRKERNIAGRRWGPDSRHEIASFEGVLSTLIIGPGEIAAMDAPAIYHDDTQMLSYGTGDRWLHRRYRGKFLSRITFAALPETPMQSLAQYFDPPLSPEQATEATIERAAGLYFFRVPSPAHLLELQNLFDGSRSPAERAAAALAAARANDAWLDKPKVFDLIDLALQAHPGDQDPEHVTIVRGIVRNHFAVYRDLVRKRLDSLVARFPNAPLVRALQEDYIVLEAREKRRLSQYLFR